MAKVIDMTPDAQAEYCTNHPNSKICELLGFGNSGKKAISSEKSLQLKKNIIKEIAKPSADDLDLLEMLSKDQSIEIRAEVANNIYTPDSILMDLAKDEEWFVRFHVAHNPKTTLEVLETLVQDSDDAVKGMLVYHHNSNADLLNKLFNGKLKHSKCLGFAKNPNTPPEILEELTTFNGLKETKFGCKKGDFLETSILVALHPNTSVETLKKLSKHSNGFIRENALTNIKSKVNIGYIFKEMEID